MRADDVLIILFFCCRVAYMHLSNVRKIRNMLTDEAASQLIHAFITFRIDYCNFN